MCSQRRYSLQQGQSETDGGIKQWHLFSVMKMSGCSEECCVTTVHGLTELDILCAHSNFSDMSANEQNTWIIQYLCTHCQMNEDSQDKDTKGVQYIITGKSVCQSVWLGVLGLSLSRFYRLRKEFEATGTASIDTKRPRSRASIFYGSRRMDGGLL